MEQTTLKARTVFCHDNLPILRGINSHSIDLIYLDPPFNKGRAFHAPIGTSAEGAEFRDIWSSGDVKDEWHNELNDRFPALYKYLDAVEAIGSRSAKYYLIYMAVRLIEMHRILKDTGSLYLHCDPTAGHYLKLLLDTIFGHTQFRNELIWSYGLGGSSARIFSRKHDVIFFYSQSDTYHFRKPLVAATSLRMRGQKKGMLDVWTDIPSLNNMARERVGYPTQKPLALLERIISASSEPGALVLDPFCGCATTCIAAEKLGRQWIGIDVSEKAHQLMKMRLQQEVPADLLRGDPIFRTDIPLRTDRASKRAPTIQDKHQLYGQQDGRCAGCVSKFDLRHLELDHIIPQSHGGGHELENLQLLCGSCNRIKGNRPMEYLQVRMKAFLRAA